MGSEAGLEVDVVDHLWAVDSGVDHLEEGVSEVDHPVVVDSEEEVVGVEVEVDSDQEEDSVVLLVVVGVGFKEVVETQVTGIGEVVDEEGMEVHQEVVVISEVEGVTAVEVVVVVEVVMGKRPFHHSLPQSNLADIS